MYLSPGGFQLASGVGSTQPDPTARGSWCADHLQNAASPSRSMSGMPRYVASIGHS